MHDIDRTLTSYEAVPDAYEAEADQFEFEYSADTVGESPFNEEEEIDLASELMGVATEAELDQFLGDLFKKAARTVRKVAPRVMRLVRPMIGALKPLAKQALPALGGALGAALGGAAGTVAMPGVGTVGGGALGTSAGSALGTAVADALEMEFEGMTPDEKEFEAARRIVRIAGSAVQNAAQARPDANPVAVVRNAVTAAAQQHVPGLAGTSAVSGAPGRSGRWIRRGNRIILLGV